MIKKKFEKQYEQEEKNFIANFRENKFFGVSYNPQAGKAHWDNIYPDGYYSWVAQSNKGLSCYGQQILIDKIDEIIKHINS